MKVKNCAIGLVLFLATIPCLRADGTAGEAYSYESQKIIDMPTAGVLPKKGLYVNTTISTGGGLLAEASYGIFRRINIGVSFGGSKVIGEETVDWQKYPGLSIKARPIEETYNIPAITVGFSTQGYGVYDDKSDRYEFMSPGAYLAASKNFRWALGALAVHGGLNYSLEPKQGSLNYYLGLEQALGSSFALNMEYNFNRDENSAFVKEKGLLNLAARWSFTREMTFSLQLRDLLGSRKSSEQAARWLSVEYISGI